MCLLFQEGITEVVLKAVAAVIVVKVIVKAVTVRQKRRGGGRKNRRRDHWRNQVDIDQFLMTEEEGDPEIMTENLNGKEEILRVRLKKEYPKRKTRILKLKKKRRIGGGSMIVKNSMTEDEMTDIRSVINMTEKDQAPDPRRGDTDQGQGQEGRRDQCLLGTGGIGDRRTSVTVLLIC